MQNSRPPVAPAYMPAMPSGSGNAANSDHAAFDCANSAEPAGTNPPSKAHNSRAIDKYLCMDADFDFSDPARSGLGKSSGHHQGMFILKHEIAHERHIHFQ